MGVKTPFWQVDISSGAFRKLAEFADIPNPLFPGVGGPSEEAVPTGIAYSGGRLLVAIFSGAPFAPGTSSIQQVFLNGTQMPFVTGLKTSIGVLPIDSDNDSADDRHENRDDGDDAEYLVLENTSTGPFLNGPGLVLRIVETDRPPTVLANCLTRPTAMTLDRREHTLYVTDLAGHVVAIPLPR